MCNTNIGIESYTAGVGHSVKRTGLRYIALLSLDFMYIYTT